MTQSGHPKTITNQKILVSTSHSAIEHTKVSTTLSTVVAL
jgi:hypothetical protein